MKNLSFSIFVYIPVFGIIVTPINGCLEESKRPVSTPNIMVMDPTTKETVIETREYKQSPKRNPSQDPFRIESDEGGGQEKQMLERSWAEGEKEDGKNGKDKKDGQKYQLFVHAIPRDSKIRIMNINPKYKPGILLKPGKYDIEVSKGGYNTNRQWITIEHEDFHLEVELVKR